MRAFEKDDSFAGGRDLKEEPVQDKAMKGRIHGFSHANELPARAILPTYLIRPWTQGIHSSFPRNMRSDLNRACNIAYPSLPCVRSRNFRGGGDTRINVRHSRPSLGALRLPIETTGVHCSLVETLQMLHGSENAVSEEEKAHQCMDCQRMLTSLVAQSDAATGRMT